MVGEDVGAGDRAPEVACAEQRDVVLPGSAQDLPDLRDQRVDVVADAALAELPEPGQVAPDLSGVDVRVVRQLLGGDGVLPHLLGLGEHLEVTRESSGDTQREPVASSFGQVQTAAIHAAMDAHEPTLSSSRPSSSGFTRSSKAASPSTSRTGMRSP